MTDTEDSNEQLCIILKQMLELYKAIEIRLEGIGALILLAKMMLDS
jgi:hypothetical protein